MTIADTKRQLQYYINLPIVEDPNCSCGYEVDCKHWNGFNGYDYFYHLGVHFLIKYKGDEKKAFETIEKIFGEEYGLSGFQANSAIQVYKIYVREFN